MMSYICELCCGKTTIVDIAEYVKVILVETVTFDGLLVDCDSRSEI